MSNTEIEAALAFLRKFYLSPRHVTTFECGREQPDGGHQDLVIEIHDYGTAGPAKRQRYMGVFKTKSGRGLGCSNLMQTVESALAVKIIDLKKARLQRPKRAKR
jgi:hypothetical protein